MDLTPQIFPYSVVKQDERNLSFFWSKTILEAFKKNPRKGKFWIERKNMHYPENRMVSHLVILSRAESRMVSHLVIFSRAESRMVSRLVILRRAESRMGLCFSTCNIE